MTYREDGRTTHAERCDPPRVDGGIAEVLAVVNRAREVLGRLESLRNHALGAPLETSSAVAPAGPGNVLGSLDILLAEARNLDRDISRAHVDISRLGDALTL